MRLLSLVTSLAFLCAFFSCKEVTKKKAPQEFFQKELFSAYSFHQINEDLVNSDELKMAQGVWSSALRVSVYGNDFERADYCLLVNKPQALDPGRMRFVLANDFKRPCSDYLFAPPASNELEFYNLYIELKNKELTLKVDDKTFHYALFNQNNDWGVGVSPYGLKTQREKLALKDGVICQEAKDDCSVTEDRCSDCENGSYYLKTSACSRALSRVCGRDECGLRGRPACIRGEVSTGVKTYCIQDSPVGFCVGNARVACVDGALICE